MGYENEENNQQQDFSGVLAVILCFICPPIGIFLLLALLTHAASEGRSEFKIDRDFYLRSLDRDQSDAYAREWLEQNRVNIQSGLRRIRKKPMDHYTKEAIIWLSILVFTVGLFAFLWYLCGLHGD